MRFLAVSVLTIGAAVLAASAAAPKSAEPAEPKAPKIKGTIKVEGNPPVTELKKKVKITQADAEKAAIKAVGVNGAKVDDSELEIEQGFLIYSVDVKVAGKKGLEEIWIDAGNGKVLMQRHETDEDEEDEDEPGEDAGKDDSE